MNFSEKQTWLEHRAVVLVLFQGVQQVTGKAEISCHKLRLVFGTVYASQIEYKVSLGTVIVQHGRVRVQVVLVDLINREIRAGAIAAILDRFEIFYKVTAHKAHGPSYQNIHALFASRASLT